MGYFANGMEGMDYQDRYCWRCRHWPNDEVGCPLWMEQQLHNGDGDEVLAALIPRAANGLSNDRCRMFLPRGASDGP